MSKKHEIFESCLSSAFNKEQFIRFIRELLNDAEIISSNKTPFIPQNFYGYIKAYSHIANYTDSNDDRIAVFTVGLASEKTVEMARSMQRNFVKKLIEDSGCSGALVAFYTEDEPGKWRLSFIRIDYEFSQGTITEKITPAKRYSYLVGDKEPCHTAKQRLLPIFLNDDRNPTLDEIEEAFSVEPVTKEFFDLYCKKYLDLKEYLEGNADFMKEADTHKFTSEQFAKKLMGQIVFLYFIQKKGWMGVDVFETKLSESEYNKAFWNQKGRSRELIPMLYRHDPDGIYRINVEVLTSLSDEDEEIVAKCFNGAPWGSGPKDFMRRIFDGCIANDMNFFDDYLEPLFYTGLNKNRGENSFYAPLHRRVPFLNGGLFEELDGYDWEHCYFGIPNEMFSNENDDGILDIFDRYNFTMNEDEPLEKEVAIDPEMLGKVFENLLDVKDRKSKGAFYTPREIVHYMCQESLINYLANKTKISEHAIRDFILYGEFMRDEDTKNTIYVKAEGKSKGHFEFDYSKDLFISNEILDFKCNLNRLKDLDDALATVKVVDPAVGSGAFPLGMLNEIVKARNVLTDYMSIGMNSPQKFAFIASERKLYKLKTDTIKNCIFACDIEPSAVDISKLRLWLSIVIDDKTYNNDNMVFDQSTKPRPLPNLDCNIICGNSLIDEFKGIQLITESSVLNNLSTGAQVNVNQSAIDVLIDDLITLQDKLFFTKEHEDKDDIKGKIQDIYNQIILEQIKVNQKTVEAYYESLDAPAQPFILWQLRFPRVFKDNGGFDIAIGNPPYVSAVTGSNDDGSKKNRELLRNRYSELSGAFDLYVVFLLLGLNITNETGIYSWIIPNKFLVSKYAEKTNSKLRNHGFYKMLSVSEINVFHNVGVYPIILHGDKSTPSINYHEVEANSLSAVIGRDFQPRKKTKEYPTFKDKKIKMASGATGFQAQQIKEYIHSGKQSAEDIPFTVSGAVDKYSINNSIVRYMKEKYEHPYIYKGKEIADSKWDFWCSPKVVIAGMTKEIEAVYSEAPLAMGVGIYGIYEFGDYLPKCLAAILNSSLLTYFLTTMFKEKHLAGGYLAINKNTIEQLPLVDIPLKLQEELSSLYDLIVMEYENDGNPKPLEIRVDEIVYQLYEITEDEIKSIQEAYKHE